MIELMVMLGIFASVQNAAAPAAAPEPRQIAEDAMKFVVANDMKGLFELIGRHMPMKAEELETIHTKTLEARKVLPEQAGKVLGYAFISECRRSDIFVQFTFVEKREKAAVRWQFLFYKPRNTWQMTYFFFDQDLKALFASCA